MKKVINYFSILLSVSLIIAGTVFLTGCTTEGAKPAETAVTATDSGPAIVTKPGYYEDKTIGFSLTYLADLFSVENELTKGVVLFREHAQQVPSIVIRVEDKPEGVALENIGEWFKEFFKAINPESDRFKIVEDKMAKLSTGVDAHQTIIKWRYQGTVPLYTAVVSVYKNDKIIHVLTTSVPGQPAPKVLMQMAMALKITL